MSTQPTTRPRYSFGPFEFDSNTSELRKHRSLIRIQGQPLRILSILLDQPCELVGRLELQRELWPGATSGDFDHGLNAAVNKHRQALNDSKDQPRYIEALPGQGYRFIANSRKPKVRHTTHPRHSVHIQSHCSQSLQQPAQPFMTFFPSTSPPDGTRFLIPTVSSSESPGIVVVRNWEAVFLPSAAK